MIRNYDELSDAQKKEWVASLEVGDEVVVKRDSYGYGGSTTYYKGKVTGITKTGRVNVLANEQKHTFTKDGRYWGNRGDTWSRVNYHLRQMDEMFVNHRRKVINQTIFEESMKKLENAYKSLQSVEEIEKFAYEISTTLTKLKL